MRDTILFSYQHGGASLLDFLNAESDYRSVELNYVNLVGSYLTAAAQLNQAVGRRGYPMKSERMLCDMCHGEQAKSCAGSCGEFRLASLGGTGEGARRHMCRGRAGVAFCCRLQ